MRRAFFMLMLSVLHSPVEANQWQTKYPPELAGAEVEVYKTVGDVDLNIYVFKPDDHDATERRAAIVFFFGGGWTGGNPAQFYEHCKHLAARGMVAMTADYRVSSRHGTKPTACVEDGKSAVNWIRANADRLGIDPDRVAAGGGSAGGHVAACTGVVPGFDDATGSSIPNALVLFNPALVLGQAKGHPQLDQQRVKRLRERIGADPKSISPFHHVQQGVPPTIIFHGKADTTVAYWTAEAFDEAMKTAGNRCELVGFEGQSHGFFNHGRGDGSAYRQTVQAMDQFLESLGFVEKPEPSK